MMRAVGLMALVLLSACSESFLAAWAVHLDPTGHGA